VKNVIHTRTSLYNLVLKTVGSTRIIFLESLSYVFPCYLYRTYVYNILGYNGARTVLPCFNEPDFKSQFLVSVEHDKDLTAISNTPLDKQVSMGNGMVKSIFEPTVQMSSYHLAFAISDFANVSTTTKRGTKVNPRN